eukprot:643393-Amphidinium_carterae.1
MSWSPGHEGCAARCGLEKICLFTPNMVSGGLRYFRLPKFRAMGPTKYVLLPKKKESGAVGYLTSAQHDGTAFFWQRCRVVFCLSGVCESGYS